MGISWITPKEDYANNYVPTPTDFNRIESNIDYIREQDGTFNGAKTFTGIITISGSGEIFRAGSNSDITASIGRGKLGFASASDEFLIGHYDFFNASNYGFRQVASGDTWLNARSTSKVGISNNGGTILATFEATKINFEKEFNPTTTPTEGSWTIPATGYYNPPRGVYQVSLEDIGGSNYTVIEANINGTWRPIANSNAATNYSLASYGCFFMSNGTNIRISTALTTNTNEVYYQKY